jgi:hypothetical protein
VAKTLGLIRGTVELPAADERACTLVRLDEPVVFELPIGADNGVGIDLEVYRKLAHCRQLIAGAKTSGCDRSSSLIYVKRIPSPRSEVDRFSPTAAGEREHPSGAKAHFVPGALRHD